MYRELTKEEQVKYKSQIEASRASADSYVFGYKKKEVMCEKSNEIKTLARGNDGAGWINVAHCSID